MQQPSKSTVQQDLQRQVEEFLAAGGKVKTVRPGATGEDQEHWSWNASQYPISKKKGK